MKPITVTNEIPPVALDVPLSAEHIAQAKRIRWQWTLLHNRLRSEPWNSATDTHLARCDEVIAIIDGLLAAQPTQH